jgi:hypothetical protein
MVALMGVATRLWGWAQQVLLLPFAVSHLGGKMFV